MKKIAKIRKQTKHTKFVDIISKILENEAYDKIVKWSEDETKILILDKKKLESIVLPKYFRHANYNSFKRQMNFYDFKQNRNVNGILYFENSYFQKGKICYSNLQRKRTQRSELMSLQHENSSLQDILKELFIQQEQLKKQLIQALQLNQQIQQNVLIFVKNLMKLKVAGQQQVRQCLQTIVKIFRGMIPDKQYLFSKLINYLFPQEEAVNQYNEEIGFHFEESNPYPFDEEMQNYDVDNSFQFWTIDQTEYFTLQ